MIKEFEEEGIRGFKGYVKQFFEALKRPPESFKCIIRTDDYIYTHKAYMILIANASYYRSGANMNPTGYIDDGRFEIVVFRPYDKWFWRSISGAFLGNLHRKPNIKTYDCTSAQIEINPPEELQVDGEHLGKSKMVSAKILKHALEIILP
jgi:diacylglycerol kinase family enzyme